MLLVVNIYDCLKNWTHLAFPFHDRYITASFCVVISVIVHRNSYWATEEHSVDLGDHDVDNNIAILDPSATQSTFSVVSRYASDDDDIYPPLSDCYTQQLLGCDAVVQCYFLYMHCALSTEALLKSWRPSTLGLLSVACCSRISHSKSSIWKGSSSLGAHGLHLHISYKACSSRAFIVPRHFKTLEASLRWPMYVQRTYRSFWAK